MGCDIHFYIQKRDPSPALANTPEEWDDWGQIEVGRNYSLFGAMAGVRGFHMKAVAEPRGLPIGGFSARQDFEEEGGHSASWLWVEELQEAVERTLADGSLRDRQRTQEEFAPIFAALRLLENKPHACRVVFWFDN